ncbi:hypothetical protein [Nocardia wallacei]|uniref:hypothetical protein n=1 Tax=Nocardia wallacei TaxID=480035 RepID=UPI002458989F|nr:hypothetical protein [Nocardia wallacei]
MPAEDWERAGDYARRRRVDLGLTQSQVQGLGGPSPALIRRLEGGYRDAMSRKKRRDLARALGWHEDSLDNILAGGEPTPADPVQIPNIRQHLGDDGRPRGYEVTREMVAPQPLKLFGLALLANALTEAASDVTAGESPDRLVGLAHKTYVAAMDVLSDALQVDPEEARRTAAAMSYMFQDLDNSATRER